MSARPLQRRLRVLGLRTATEGTFPRMLATADALGILAALNFALVVGESVDPRRLALGHTRPACWIAPRVRHLV